MNKLDRPTFFDDATALTALANNTKVKSYPSLLPHLPALLQGYAGYVAAHGNANNVPSVALPPEISESLRKHYDSPNKDISYIKILRDEKPPTCPMCGSRHNRTLDHIMPQSNHASYAVFGLNLVPACECNSKRGAKLTGTEPGERILHPYFDDILADRLLSARFADLGAVPSTSIRVLLESDHPLRAAVDFHLKSVVLPSGIVRTMRENWADFVRSPWIFAGEFGKIVPSRAQIVEILEDRRHANDERYRSKNNWESIFIEGLLEASVVDWVPVAFNRAGRNPGDSLLPPI